MVFSEASLLSSPGAQALSELITNLASDWTSKTATRDEVAIVFGTLQQIMTRALANVAVAWNTTHDAIRVLPPEVQEACFALLSVSEKGRLSRVCSHWRSDIARLHGIWSKLDIQRWNSPFDALLARSGQLPLDLVIANGMNVIHFDNSIRPHAHRLRSLKLDLQLSPFGDVPVLGFPVPLLEELSIQGRHRETLSLSHLSEQTAPRLRALSLTSVSVPSEEDVVFGRVTTLTLATSNFCLNHLFRTFPALAHLRIHGLWTDLPNLPAPAPLRTLELEYSSNGIGSLFKQGYTRLEQLTVRLDDAYNLIKAAELLHEHPSSLQERANHEIVLMVCPAGGRMLRFVVSPRWTSILQHLLCDNGTSFRALGRLVLPASVRRDTEAILLAGAVADLPALRSIAIACAARRPAEQSLTIFACTEGTIRAPALARIEVLAVASAYGLDVERVDAGRLAAFITDCLICDERGAIDLLVDATRGAQLVGDAAALRACVRNLLLV